MNVYVYIRSRPLYMDPEKIFSLLIHRLLSKPRTIGLIVFFFLLVLVGLFTNQRYQIVKENEYREMNGIINEVKQNIERGLQNSYSAALTLALTINDKGEPDKFEAVADQIINLNSNFKAVQLVPNGIIKYMYPLKGNEAAINSSIFTVSREDKHRAINSIKTRKMYFVGPSVLKQGGLGLIGRLPVYRDNKFWGFSAVVIKMETFLKDVGIYNAKNSRYYFQFSKLHITSNKEEFFLQGSTDFSDHTYETVSFPDGDWRLYIIAVDKYGAIYQVLYPAIFGLFLAVLCSLLITQFLKKAAEKVIQDSRVKMESLINTIDGIVWEANSDFRLIFISEKIEHILGYTVEECLESPTFWQDHIFPDDWERVASYSALHIRNHTQYDYEYRMIAKDRSVVWLRDIVSVISEKDQPITLRGIVVDIRETKRAQQELNDSFNLVNEQNKRLLNFSYIVSHNLRSHTSNIQAIASLIERTDSDEEKDEMIQLLKTVSCSLNETLINLNKVVSIQTSIDVSRDSLNLATYTHKILHVLNDQIVLKQAEVINEIPSDVEVLYNPAYLESVLLNFIFNAIRYSHPQRKPRIQLTCSREDGQVVLMVSDNGIGIDLEKYGHQLFGMYKTFNDNPDSKGVGLFISKNQIEAMGGKVTVASVVGEGTTFKIYFK